jgi:hypothetical protein
MPTKRSNSAVSAIEGSVRIKREPETCCQKACDPCCQEDYVVDPEFVELRGQLKRFQNDIHRLSSLIKTQKPVRRLKENRKQEERRRTGAENQKEMTSISATINRQRLEFLAVKSIYQ